MITANLVGHLSKFGKCLLNTAKLVEIRRVRFQRRIACRRLKVWRVSLEHRKECRRLVEVLRVRFYHCKVCRRLEEVWRVRFDTTKHVGGL